MPCVFQLRVELQRSNRSAVVTQLCQYFSRRTQLISINWMELALGNIDAPNIPPTLITCNVSEDRHAQKGVSLFRQ